jgi:hypothetical protein
MKSQGRDKSPPSNTIVCAILDSNHQTTKIHNPPGLKLLNRKERKRHRYCRSRIQPIKQINKSYDQQTNQTMVPDSHELYGYIFKRASMHILPRKVKRPRISLHISRQNWIEQVQMIR